MTGAMRSLALVLLTPVLLAGQTVRLQGDSRHPAVLALRELLQRNAYRTLTRDTTLGAEARVPGDVVISGAEVRLEGTVDGSVAVLDGALFLRPGARVGGIIVRTPNALLLPSTRAEYGDTLVIPAEIATAVRPGPAGGIEVSVTAPPRTPLVSPGGLFGLGIPTYDRVNGLTLRGVAAVRPFGARDAVPSAQATLAFHTARGDPSGQLDLVVPLDSATRLTVSGGRGTWTQEQWIRGDLTNSLASLFLGSDARNYYESDFVRATLSRAVPRSLAVGQGFVAPRASLHASRDRSLEARDPWSLFGGEWRPNPEIAPGLLASATLGATVGWRGTSSTLAGDLAVEWAPGSVGDFRFLQLTTDGSWSATALRDHRIAVRGHLRLPVGGATPPQRWSLVGGTNTLPTLELGAQRGDHVVLVESSYAAPFNRLSLPLMGVPSLVVRHAVGSAWASGDPARDWEQNLGLGLQFRFAEVFAYVNPAGPDLRPHLSLALVLSR